MVGRDKAGRDGENKEKEEGGNAGEIATYHFHLGQRSVTAFPATLLPQRHLNLPPLHLTLHPLGSKRICKARALVAPSTLIPRGRGVSPQCFFFKVSLLLHQRGPPISGSAKAGRESSGCPEPGGRHAPGKDATATFRSRPAAAAGATPFV